MSITTELKIHACLRVEKIFASVSLSGWHEQSSKPKPGWCDGEGGGPQKSFHFRASPAHTTSARVRGVGVRGVSLCSLFLPLLQPVLQRSKSSEFNEPEIAIVKNSAALRSALRKFYPLDGTSLLTLAA